MAAYFDKLDHCSFNGIAFPVEKISIVGGARRHLHEYPHTAGGATEKLGRRVYVFRIETLFDEDWNDRYPALYPDGLEKLFAFFEQQITGGLDLPTLGKVDAWCTNWQKVMHYPIRSGERVDFEFEEDQSSLFLIDALLAAAATTIEVDNDAVLKALPDVVEPTPSIFDGLNDAVTALVALRDQNALQWDLVQTKALQVVDLARQAIAVIPDLARPQTPVVQLIELVKEVASAAQSLAEDVAQQGSPIKTYVTPTRMTIVEVSNAIYGTSSRSLELLQLNDIDDGFLIRPNTTIEYYDDGSTRAGRLASATAARAFGG